MPTPRRPSGFSLMELVVAMGASAVVLGMVVVAVNAQQRAFTSGGKQRAVQTSARAAMLFIEEHLALAGYGMDAPLAFDFDRYAGPCPAQLDPCPRDATANSDEIVFFHRNPLYWVPDNFTDEPRGNAWAIAGLGAGSVTVSARKGDLFREGEILQAVCRTGAAYAYFTVADSVAASDDGKLDVPLLPAVASDPFRRQDAATDGCFTGGQARLFRIERYRFHVRPVVNGTSVDPYLVLDRGVDVNLDGEVNADDEEILAEGIELLQLAYVMTNPALAPRGATPGTAIALAKGFPGAVAGDGLTTLDFPGVLPPGVPVYRLTSFYGYSVGPPAHATRNTDHQANIRAVRVAVRARSEHPDPAFVGGDVLVPLFNLDTLPDWIAKSEQGGRYNRATFVSTVALRNMTSRGMNDF